jgi:methyl-accepting chemotaxis protein
MTNRLQQFLGDPLQQSRVLAVLFALGILASAYALFTLPVTLQASRAVDVLSLGGARAALLPTAIVITLTLFAGLGAVLQSLRGRREIIVYREKKSDQKIATNARDSESGETSDITSYRDQLQKWGSEALEKGLNELCRQLEAGQGALYLAHTTAGKRMVKLEHGYALNLAEGQTLQFAWGEGLVGQAAASAKSFYLDEVPSGYIKILSGLGSSSPRYVFIVPAKKDENVVGVVEIATFVPLKEASRKQVEAMVQVLAEKMS